VSLQLAFDEKDGYELESNDELVNADLFERRALNGTREGDNSIRRSQSVTSTSKPSCTKTILLLTLYAEPPEPSTSVSVEKGSNSFNLGALQSQGQRRLMPYDLPRACPPMSRRAIAANVMRRGLRIELVARRRWRLCRRAMNTMLTTKSRQHYRAVA